ncbi:MAG: autoinducer binding domain-containing protein [Pelagimonas sp.]
MIFNHSAPAELTEIATKGLAIGTGNFHTQEVEVSTSYDTEWTNLYNSNGWIAIDPAVKLGMSCLGTHEWALDPRTNDFAKTAHDFGLSQGIAISSNIGGNRCIVGMCLDSPPSASTISAAKHATQRHHLAHLTAKARSLSQQQKDLVFLFSMGLRSKEVAAEFGISEDAVKQRKLTILKHIGANNFLVAVNVCSRLDCEDHLLSSKI